MTPSGIEPVTFRFVAQHLNHCATAVLIYVCTWTKYAAFVVKRRRVYRVYMGKSEGKTLLGRPMRRREDNIKTYLKKTGWKVIDWTALVPKMDKWWDVVIAVMNIRVP